MVNQLFSPHSIRREKFSISTDFEKLDAHIVHDYLCNRSYWAKGVPFDQVLRSMQYSFCFGVYAEEGNEDKQIGFARVMSDFTTFAYLADVFILESYRGQGLGKWLVEYILSYPELQNLRRWTLNTHDAHSLYTRFGFKQIPNPETSLIFRPSQNKHLNISDKIHG
ncbi:MAG: N-acetyltransferase [Chloroflexi bacterium]|nr:MAG: N-acetyltransferase [Chloroflexota bacterium]